VVSLGETIELGMSALGHNIHAKGWLSDNSLEAVIKLVLPPAFSDFDRHIFVDGACHISRLLVSMKERSHGENKMSLKEFWEGCILQIFGRNRTTGKLRLTEAEIQLLWPKVQFLLIPICIQSHWVGEFQIANFIR